MELILITGRTRRQGLNLVRGKSGDEYWDEIKKVGISSEDLEALGIKEGSRLVLETGYGKMTGIARVDEGLPRGMIFVPQGPLANRLIGGDTQGTGMPDYKGLYVKVYPG